MSAFSSKNGGSSSLNTVSRFGDRSEGPRLSQGSTARGILQIHRRDPRWNFCSRHDGLRPPTTISDPVRDHDSQSLERSARHRSCQERFAEGHARRDGKHRNQQEKQQTLHIAPLVNLSAGASDRSVRPIRVSLWERSFSLRSLGKPGVAERSSARNR